MNFIFSYDVSRKGLNNFIIRKKIKQNTGWIWGYLNLNGKADVLTMVRLGVDV